MRFSLVFAALLASCSLVDVAVAKDKSAPLRKLEDVMVYSDERFYSAFPSIVRRPNGDLFLAFRRAPNRSLFGSEANSHTDANSYLVAVRSKNQGRTWSPEPEFISAHPFGGSQDPCLLQMRDGSLLCASYGWALVGKSFERKNVSQYGDYAFLGGYTVKSEDGGRSWSEPHYPTPTPGQTQFDPFGKPVPSYNRGAICEGKDGRLFWAVAAAGADAHKTGVYLMISTNKGESWNYSCPIAVDEKVTFNESSVYETPKGDLVVFIRTAGFDDRTVVARSTDGGKTFQRWEDAGWQGHPHHAVRLPDRRVLLVYGYRHAPFGIRARVLNPECTDFRTAEEIILRDDGGNVDIGYPWATVVSKNRALVVYYFNKANGIRHIAGTFVGWD